VIDDLGLGPHRGANGLEADRRRRFPDERSVGRHLEHVEAGVGRVDDEERILRRREHQGCTCCTSKYVYRGGSP